MLMSPHDGAVDHGVFVVRIGGQMVKHSFPHPGFRPATEAPVGVLPVAESFRQVAPGNSRAVSTQNRLDESTIVAGGGANMSWPAGKQVLYPFPLVIAKSIAGHASALFKADSAWFT